MSNNKIRLLIIEPHTAVRQALATRLQSSPEVEVVAAVSYLAEAQKLVSSQKPDVVLLGLQQTNGFTTQSIIHDVKALAEATAVIVLSPYADELASNYLRQAGVRRYLLKDINAPQLIREIETVATNPN